jgi:hypothetical protein
LNKELPHQLFSDLLLQQTTPETNMLMHERLNLSHCGMQNSTNMLMHERLM